MPSTVANGHEAFTTHYNYIHCLKNLMAGSTLSYANIASIGRSRLYTGITTDVERRFAKHKNKRGGHYTASHRARKILYTEKHGTKGDALKREAEIKSWRREKKMELASGIIRS